MVDIRNAQRSFNNSWLLREAADIPSGVVLDIAVTTPLMGDVYVAKLTEDNGYLSMSLKQDDMEIAYMRTSVVGSPIRMTATLVGVCAVVVLGHIPEGLSFTNPRNSESPLCVISPELVTYFNYNYLTSTSPGEGDMPGGGGSGGPGTPVLPNGLVNAGTSTRPYIDVVGAYSKNFQLTGSFDIELDPGLAVIPDPDNLIIDITPDTISWGVTSSPGKSSIYSINGIQYPANVTNPQVSVTITPPIGGTINIVPVSYDAITLESSPLQICEANDPIDNYIAPKDDTCRILDMCYDKEKTRKTYEIRQIYTFGFSEDLGFNQSDPKFD